MSFYTGTHKNGDQMITLSFKQFLSSMPLSTKLWSLLVTAIMLIGGLVSGFFIVSTVITITLALWLKSRWDQCSGKFSLR